MTNEAELRAAIVAEAISWERTPYAPFGRLKGVGCDCATFTVCVYSACNCAPRLGLGYYSQQSMLHTDEELYLDRVRMYTREIPLEDARPADLIIWKFGLTFSHSGIMIDPPADGPGERHVMHAVIKGGAVIRADIDRDEDLRTLPRKAFNLFAKDGSGPIWRPVS